jgi:hypothetical protein
MNAVVKSLKPMSSDINKNFGYEKCKNSQLEKENSKLLESCIE